MDSTQELIEEVKQLKLLALRNAKPLLDEQISRCVPAIVVDRRNGEILHSTPPANSLFGYSEGELDGLNIESLIPQRFRSKHTSHLMRYNEDPRPRQMGEIEMELWGMHKHGDEFKIEINLYPIDVIGKSCVVATLFKSRK